MPRPEERDFAGFRIVRPLELGERASVWEAEDPDGGEPVAIETLAGDASRDEDVTEWFTEAWELVSELDHRGIVSVLLIDEQDDVPFAVRTPAGELTLADRLEQGGPLASGAALQVLTEVGEALEAAHEAGVVHGALEPECVALDVHARAHLAGFGRREGDRREDVRALGSLLVEMLGDPPEEAVEDEDAPDDVQPDAEDESQGEADGAGDDEADEPEPEPEVPSRWEAERAEVLREVGRAGADGQYARAADLVAAARAARPAREDVTSGDGGGHGRIVAWVLAAVVAVILLIVLLSGGDDDESGASQGATDQTTTSAVDTAAPPPATGPSRPVPVRGFPVGVSARDGVVYAVTRDGGSLDGFDEETGTRVLGPVQLAGEAHDVTVVDGVAWVTTGPEGALSRIDLALDDPAPTTLAAGSDPGPVIGALGSIWVVDRGEAKLLRFPQELTEDTTPETFGLEASKPVSIAFGQDALWVADAGGKVLRIDPADPSKQRSYDVGGRPGSVLVVGDAVWVTDEADGAVVQLDPETGKTLSIPVGGEPTDLAADPERLWVANADGYVTAIIFATGATELVDLSGAGGSPQSIAVGQQVWVTTGSGNTLVAIAPASG